MVIIQRRVFNGKGEPTRAIGFYDDSDKLIGALWDRQRKIRFASQPHKLLVETTNYWEPIFREQGMTNKAIRKQDKQTIAAHAWGWLEPMGAESHEDDEA